MKKRILSVLLAVALVVSAVVITAFAANYDGEKTPAIVFEPTYPAQTVSVTQIAGVSLTSGIKVADVGADYIKFENIDTTNVVQLKGSTIEYAKVTGGVAGAYSSTGAITGTTVTEYTLAGLEEGATYSIRVTSGRLSKVDGTNNLRNLVASDPIEVTLISFTDAGKWPTPTGISTDAGKLIGTEAGKTYQYVKLSAPDFTVDEAGYVDYNATSTTLAAGLYAVRIKEGTEGTNKYQTSDSAIVLVKGANSGTLTFAVSALLTQGAWTLYSGDPQYGSAAPGIRNANKDFATYVAYANKDTFNARSYSYRFKDDEIISADDFFDITVCKNYNMGDLIDSNDDNNLTVYGLATFHVAGASVDSYKVPFTWTLRKSNAKIKIDLAGTFPEREGYIYGLDIKLYDETSANNGHIIPLTDYAKNPSNNGTYVYQMFMFNYDSNTRIVCNARAPEPAPVLVAEGTETAGTYRIFGLDATKSYAISTDGSTFNDVPANSSYVDVTSTGTYYVYAKATATSYDSAVASVRIDGSMPAIPEGTIYYDEATGYIKGLDAEANKTATGIQTVITYDWCRVSIDGLLSWDQSVTSDTGSIQVGPGYYAIRYAARDAQHLVAGATTYIFVYEGGSNKGTVSGATAPDADRTNTFTSGLWTISSPNGGSGNKAYPIAATNGLRLAAAYNPNVDNIANLAWQYQLADDEIFPLEELGSLKFLFGFENGNPFNADYNGYVRIYVAAGDKAYYDVPFVASNRTMFTVDVASIWADEVDADPNFAPSGYVIALEIHYFSETTAEGIAVKSPAQNYAVLTLNGFDTVTKRSSSFINLKEVVDITTIKAVPAVGTYGGEIIGLNPEVVYQVADYDESTQTLGEWSFAPVGTYVNLPAGTYAIRSYSDATNAKYLTSDYVIVTIDPAPAGDQRESAKVDKLILPEEVELSEASYIFDINESRWINRLALSNIVKESPNANVIFEADTYRFTISAADIDLSLDTAHYFDMKVTFDGESAYDRMFPKMKALADEKEFVHGVHFESSTPYFFEKATFEVFLGEKYDGYDVELRSYNERVNRLRNEETVTVDGGWATFTTFGGDYLILCPAMAEE